MGRGGEESTAYKILACYESMVGLGLPNPDEVFESVRFTKPKKMVHSCGGILSWGQLKIGYVADEDSLVCMCCMAGGVPEGSGLINGGDYHRQPHELRARERIKTRSDSSESTWGVRQHDCFQTLIDVCMTHV